MTQLQTEFTSVYRLFLRSLFAAVLHHPQATRNLRRLWRPMFESGARVTRQLQHSSVVKGSPESELHANWLKLWDQRINNTLALLYYSSQNRGLSHKLTRNLAFLVTSEHQRVRFYKLNAWDPRFPQQFSNLSSKAKRKQEKNKKFQEFVARSWAPLDKVMKLAEAKDGLTLGKIRVKGWKARFMRERGL